MEPILKSFESVVNRVQEVLVGPAPRVFIPFVPKEIPEWKKIWEPLIFGGCAIGGVLLLSRPSIYKRISTALRSLWRRDRQLGYKAKSGGTVREWWNNLGLAKQTLAVIIAVNGTIFMMWQIDSLVPQMHELFTFGISYAEGSVRAVPQLLTSIFSHQTANHFALNATSLWTFGVPLLYHLELPSFLALYVAGGVFGSMTAFYSRLLLRQSFSTLGSSGAVFALVSAFSFAYPSQKMRIALLPFIEVPASLFLLVDLAYNVVGAVGHVTGKFMLGDRHVEHFAHIGGILFGYVFMKTRERFRSASYLREDHRRSSGSRPPQTARYVRNGNFIL
eukprot:TRINITY_DN12133_c0_g1_i1.p1 TRINITY_DN12133_c0_g1~~TRINITY_DN12133_c0_g1_i1.p1  ORF type:complete len:333 (-),score=45.99 TRINITY_DN12133_c0_g1_i1:8-1006(-)